MKKPLGLYIHIPFCVSKCHYCDFLSFGGSSREQRERYTDALVKEIENAATGEYLVDTVFIGGGTPSILEPELMSKIMMAVKKSFEVAQGGEISVEANPGTLTEDKLKTYKSLGINRLSMGLQTTDNQLLNAIGRVHSFEQFLDNYHLARELGFDNINVDLIFALEGQTVSGWRETVETVLDLEPEHLSFYSLQIEEGTLFFEKFRQGELTQVDDGEDRFMYHDARRMLSQAGYVHYEISNGARPGRECRHNLKYWSMEDYLGLGLGAHSYMSGVRFSNTRTLEAYLKGSEPDWIMKNDRRDSITDYMFTGLRKVAGVSLEDFQNRYGQRIEVIYGQELAILRKDGLVEFTAEHLRLTEKGMDLANRVMEAFMEPLA